jgi:hypothetical protein
MEIVGKITQVLPLQQGVSKTSGKDWQLQGYVMETQEQYPKKVHFEIFGEDRIKSNLCEIDEIVTVSFDIESREFNGRWYTSIRAWKVVKGDTTIQTPTEEAVEIVNENVDALADMPDASKFREEQEKELNNYDLPF